MPGLIQFGHDSNGNQLYWLTEGKPNQWPIVVHDCRQGYETFQGPMTRFFVSAFQEKYPEWYSGEIIKPTFD